MLDESHTKKMQASSLRIGEQIMPICIVIVICLAVAAGSLAGTLAKRAPHKPCRAAHSTYRNQIADRRTSAKRLKLYQCELPP